jgi:5-methylthioadenosine/S-adenosylhomocysteine deaminase
MERTLIKNAAIISVDPKIGDLHRGDILIEGSKIAA